MDNGWGTVRSQKSVKGKCVKGKNKCVKGNDG